MKSYRELNEQGKMTEILKHASQMTEILRGRFTAICEDDRELAEKLSSTIDFYEEMLGDIEERLKRDMETRPRFTITPPVRRPF